MVGGGGNLSLLERIKELKNELESIEQEIIEISENITTINESNSTIINSISEINDRLFGYGTNNMVEFLHNVKRGLTCFATNVDTTNLPVNDQPWTYAAGIAIRRVEDTFVILFGRDGSIATAMLKVSSNTIKWVIK